MSARARLFVTALGFALLCASPASAQQPTRLYTNPGFYAVSARSLALGGAYVGIAEGASFTSNHASFAAPGPWEGQNLEVDFTLQGATTFGEQDLDHDGRLDGGPTWQGVLGASLRYRAFGLGAWLQGTQLTVANVDANLGLGGTSVAVAFWDGQLFGAAGLQLFAPSLTSTSTKQQAMYGGAGPTADLLLRIRGAPWRAGFSFRPHLRAVPAEGTPLPEDLRAPTEIVAPRVLSLGWAMRLGEGASGWNLARPRDDDPTAVIDATQLVRDMLRSRVERPPGRWLVTAQVDAAFPVEGATMLRAFAWGTAPRLAGDQFTLTPRVGAEHVTFPGRLRLRAGSWLETAPLRGEPPRVHATAGFDLFLFHLLFDWGLTGSIDTAPRVAQGGVSFGIWN